MKAGMGIFWGLGKTGTRRENGILLGFCSVFYLFHSGLFTVLTLSRRVPNLQ